MLLTYKDRKERAICTQEFPQVQATQECCVYVIENSKKNVDRVVQAWAQLSQSPQIKIIFVNLSAQGKWILWPAVHAKIAEESNLKEGLLGLSETVPFTDEEVPSEQQKE